MRPSIKPPSRRHGDARRITRAAGREAKRWRPA